MTDLFWYTGGSQARTYHRIDDNWPRHTVCGRFVGGGQLAGPGLIPAHMRECRRCYGHSQPRKPILEGRRNEP